MKAAIFVDRRDALQAGVDAEGEYTLTFNPADLTPQQRNELALSKEVNGAFDVNHNYDSYFLHPPNLKTHNSDWPCTMTINDEIKPVRADLDTLRRLLDARIKARAELVRIAEEQQAEKDRKIFEAMKAFIALPPEKQVHHHLHPGGYGRTGVYQWLVVNLRESRFTSLGKATDWAREKDLKLSVPDSEQVVAEFREAVADAESLIFWLQLEETLKERAIERAKEAAKQKKRAEEAKAKKRRERQFGLWVAAMCDEVDQMRYTDGYFPEWEIVAQISKKVFSLLADFPRYKRLKASDVCEYPSEHDVEWDVLEGTDAKLSREEYEQRLAIEKTLGDTGIPYYPGNETPVEWEVIPRRHRGCCIDCLKREGEQEDGQSEFTISRLGFMVNMKVGELNLTREYGMPDEGE